MQVTTKMRELREKPEADLAIRERELAEQLFALRLQKVTGQLEKPSKIKSAKRELARVLTVAGQKRALAKPSTATTVTTVATAAALTIAPPAAKPTKKAAEKKAAKGAGR